MLTRWLKGERGFSLMEVMIALGILGFIGVAFLTALATAARSTGTLDEQVVAESLAREQIAEIMSQAWSDTYTVVVTPPAGYSPPSIITGTATPIAGKTNDCKLQSITVSISKTGGKPVFSVTTYRHNPDSVPC